MCAESDASPANGPARRGKLVSALRVLPQAPARFTCPLGGCLMVEPVTLINSGRDFDRRSLECWRKQGGKCCPLTGLPLEGWVMLVSNEGLRREIKAWACSVGLDLDVLAEVAYRSSSAPSACSDLARSCAAVDTKVCAGKGTGSCGFGHAAYTPRVSEERGLQRRCSL